jgi:hypothetical protein
MYFNSEREGCSHRRHYQLRHNLLPAILFAETNGLQTKQCDASENVCKGKHSYLQRQLQCFC